MVNADTLKQAISPVVDRDIVLVSDGHRGYPPCATAMGVRHEALNLSAGERARGAFHIQTVNSRHSQLKDFTVASQQNISTTTCNGFISSNSHHRCHSSVNNEIPQTGVFSGRF